ncbi:outer membrane beta-barrel protein [Thalassotalea nanhaiensis]|uniref:Outer membrane beta-barrel protein n=1 Tax=Thalassotalea nanhaiensis TaxID=3065648 RepID=A0ABY9TRB4_9GAMM|nr:outer membrane beta-barrel protein [Colwelliaceae bacterium SQ345]
MKNLLLAFLLFSCKVYSSDVLPLDSHFSIELGGGNIQLNDFKLSGHDVGTSQDVLIAKLKYHYNSSLSYALSFPTPIDCYSCGGFSTDNNGGWQEVDYKGRFFQVESQFNYPLNDKLFLNLIAGINYSDEDIDVQECQSKGLFFGQKWCDSNDTVDDLSETDIKYSVVIGIGATYRFTGRWSVQSNYKYIENREGLGIFELTIGYHFR